MKPPAPIVALVVLAGCGGAQRAAQDLGSQMAQLRAEQERQAHRLELLENRVMLAEDSARLARQALMRPRGRATVRIAPGDGDESVGPAAPPGIPDGRDVPDVPEVSPDEGADRPVVHATGRDRPPDPGPPIVVHQGDRLPVVPVPPAPAAPGNSDGPARPSQSEHGPGPESALPTGGVPGGGPSEGVSSARDPRAAEAYEQAVALARGGRCPEALAALGEFLVRWPDHPFADHAMFWRGQCMLSSGQARRASEEFEGLLSRFPVGSKAPDALFELVACYRRLGDEPRARTAAGRLLRDFPRSKLAARLRTERNQ